jgi:hypothetical protein
MLVVLRAGRDVQLKPSEDLSAHANHLLPPTDPDFIKGKQVASDIVSVVGRVRDWELYVVDDSSTSNAFV